MSDFHCHLHPMASKISTASCWSPSPLPPTFWRDYPLLAPGRSLLNTALGELIVADYALSRLSHRSFEHLVQALAVKTIGPGIVVFGDGPDGGREATFERKVAYPDDLDPWDGYGVVQAKFLQRPSGTPKDGDWAVDQLKAELGKYLDSDKNLRQPDYFIFATNAVLTPVNERGSKDRAVALLEEFKENSSLKGYAIWGLRPTL